MESLKRKALRRLAALKNARAPFEMHWRELSDYILPTSTRFFVSDVNQNRRNSKIINSAPRYASRVQTSGMMSGITSPSKQWFKLATDNPNLNEHQTVKAWLDAVRDTMSEVFSRSNFYQCMSTLYQHIGTFATAAMIIEESSDKVIRCESFPVGSYYIAQDSSQRVNTFYREFTMTVEQLVDTFGVDKVSLQVKSMYELKDFDRSIEVVHVIEVNREHNENYADSKHKSFRSIYFESGGDSDALLRDAGYDEFPIMVARWEVNGEDTYGTNSPGMVCLGDAKALQLEERRKAKVTDLITDPPMGAPTSLRNQRTNLVPGGLTYYDSNVGNQRIEPVISVDPKAITIMQQDIAEYERKIDQAYFVDLFLMLANTDRRNITATEILERKEEKLLMLGPVLSRLDNDFLDPAITRTFNILLRRNLLPPPPPEIEGMDIKVEYISVLAQAQKSVGMQNVERFVGFLGSLAPAKPEIMDILNTDEMTKQYADMAGVDAGMLNSEEIIQQVREQRQQQMQMQQMQQAVDMGVGMSQGVKNLSGIQGGGGM